MLTSFIFSKSKKNEIKGHYIITSMTSYRPLTSAYQVTFKKISINSRRNGQITKTLISCEKSVICQFFRTRL